MEFATTVHSGLLLLNGRYDGKHNFIAMKVSGKDKFGSGFHFFPTKLLLHQMWMVVSLMAIGIK